MSLSLFPKNIYSTIDISEGGRWIKPIEMEHLIKEDIQEEEEQRRSIHGTAQK